MPIWIQESSAPREIGKVWVQESDQPVSIGKIWIQESDGPKLIWEDEVQVFSSISFQTDIRDAGGSNTKNSYDISGLDSGGKWLVDFDDVRVINFNGQVEQWRSVYGGDTNIPVKVVIRYSANGTSGWTDMCTIFNSSMGPNSTYNITNYIYKPAASFTGSKYLSIQLQYNGSGTTFGGRAILHNLTAIGSSDTNAFDTNS